MYFEIAYDINTNCDPDRDASKRNARFVQIGEHDLGRPLSDIKREEYRRFQMSVFNKRRYVESRYEVSLNIRRNYD